MPTTINIYDRYGDPKPGIGGEKAPTDTPADENKLGTISSIDITDELEKALLYGFGSNKHGKRHAKKYKKGDLKKARDELIDPNSENCNILATVGGRIVYDAIVADSNNPPFVSLAGDMDTFSNLGNCKGGISLNSWKSNEARIKYLVDKFHPLDATFTAASVGLYYNPNSAMSVDEVAGIVLIQPAGIPQQRR